MLLLFIGANVIWSIQRFNHNKLNLITNSVDYPKALPECEKESNYKDLWDYMSNGCHYSTEDFVRTILDRVLFLTIAILVSRVLYKVLCTRKLNKKDYRLIDQE